MQTEYTLGTCMYKWTVSGNGWWGPEAIDLDEVIYRQSIEVCLKENREEENEEHKGIWHEPPKKSEEN